MLRRNGSRPNSRSGQNAKVSTVSTLQVLYLKKLIRLDSRLDCINENREGDFHREHHVHDHHVKIYSEEQTDRIETFI